MPRVRLVAALCGVAAAAATADAATAAPLRDATQHSPLEHYFTEANVHATQLEHGCTVRRWEGGAFARDPQGVVAPPYFASVDCPDGAAWSTGGAGFPVDPVSIYVWDGSVASDDHVVDLTSSFIWLNAGYSSTVTITGKAVVYGGQFRFRRSAGGAGGRTSPQFTSSYDAPEMRVYDAADAVSGVNNASFAHDPHQRDGDPDSNCFDFVYASRTRVDPPAVTVLACNASGSFVRDHFHPWGATYIPLSGTACFLTLGEEHCIAPGAARWTSPLLRYNETFAPAREAPTAAARRVISLAGFGTTLPACDRPVIMPVTNFDPEHDPEGTPNFVDVPQPGVPMVVRPPTIRTQLLAWPDGAGAGAGDDELTKSMYTSRLPVLYSTVLQCYTVDYVPGMDCRYCMDVV